MIKLLIDLFEFLGDCAPLLVSVSIFAILSILLSKSIKKHAATYYIVFAIPFILILVPFVCRLFGVEMFSFNKIPFLGAVMRDYIHMGTFGHPLLIIIMYTGALNPKIQFVKKLYSIRKELSIISGFPVLTHSLIRITNTFPNSLKFFTNNAEYMVNSEVTSKLGAGISNFSFVIGILLFVIFVPLWITSFDSVHKKMGNVKWRKLQKWAYVLYAILFIHAMGIQIGGLMNPRGKSAPQQQAQASVKETDKQRTYDAQKEVDKSATDRKPEKGRESAEGKDQARQAAQKESKEESKEVQQIKTFTDIKLSGNMKRYIHIASLVLIYGSYLYLKLRKANKKKKKILA